MNLRKLAYLLFFAAFLIALHQYLNWETWFEMRDVHHELFIAMFGFAGALLLYLNAQRKAAK